MHLILMRHGRAQEVAANGDMARPLTDRGRSDVARTGASLLGAGYRPDVVLVSTATRTLETLDVLPDALVESASVVREASLYNADLDGLLDLVARQADVGTLMIVGHNPGLAALVSFLGGDPQADGFGPADVGVFDVRIGEWNGSRPIDRFSPKP